MSGEFVLNSRIIVKSFPFPGSCRAASLLHVTQNLGTIFKGMIKGAATMNPHLVKIQEAIASLSDKGVKLALGIACLLVCEENGQIEAAIAALEDIADGQ